MEIPNDEINPDDVRPGADLTDLDLSGADLSGADLSGANLSDANLNHVYAESADFTDANLSGANLSDTFLLRTDFSNADLSDANLNNAYAERADFTDANLVEADFTNGDLRRATLTGAELWVTNLAGINATIANFNDAILVSACFYRANLEEATFNRSNLIKSDLSNARLYGAIFTDAQIDYTTKFGNHSIYDPNSNDALPAKDVYDVEDPSFYSDSSDVTHPLASAFEMEQNRLNKAAGAYQKIEKLARENALPDLQRQMFVRGRDIHRRRYRHEAFGESNWRNRTTMAFNYGFTTVSRSVFLYGESLWRIAVSSGIVIVLFGLIYAGLPIIGVPGMDTRVSELNVVESVLFSAQVFTSEASSEIYSDSPSLRLLSTIESIIGGLLSALFVFVLGRRAAR